MDQNADFPDLHQLALFKLDKTSRGQLELYPAVWSAAEALAASDAQTRRDGITRLIELDAARFSPLVVYLIATRMTDPDLEFRLQVIRELARVLLPDEKGMLSEEKVRITLESYICQMRTRQVYAILEAVNHDPEVAVPAVRIFTECAYVGNHLIEISLNRNLPTRVRNQAIYFLGVIGYISALTGLERLAARLETRIDGQQAMPFVIRDHNDEVDLLPTLRLAIERLSAP